MQHHLQHLEVKNNLYLEVVHVTCFFMPHLHQFARSLRPRNGHEAQARSLSSRAG